MKSITGRVAAASGVLTLALAGTAGAHITANPGEAPSDSYATLDFSVGHGCEESPTTQVRIKVPPSVPSVTPGVHPLWDVSTKEGKKDKVELHGETITRGVSEVTYTAKQPLPPDRLDLLTMSVKLPAGEEGESVYFPTIQRCEQGQTLPLPLRKVRRRKQTLLYLHFMIQLEPPEIGLGLLQNQGQPA